MATTFHQRLIVMQKLMKRFILLWLLVGLYQVVSAAQFMATIDKARGTLEDTFYLTLQVEGVRQTNRPQLSNSPDFTYNYQGQSSQMQIVNGKMFSKIEFRYALIPKRLGSLTVPQASVVLDGKTYHSNPITITVTKPEDRPDETKTVFVKSFLSTKEAFVNQQVLYTFELYINRNVRKRNLQFSRPPMDAFKIHEAEEKPMVIKVLGGVAFELYTVNLVLVPIKQGTVEIPPATLSGEQIVSNGRRSLFGFENTQPFRVHSQPLSLSVLPFPAQNKPSSFYGLVGKYVIDAQLSQTQLKTGESSTLTVTISGLGQAESILAPKINFPDSVKVYEDQPIYQNQTQGTRMLGQATFNYALVPSAPGTIELPPVEISLFDPATKQYEILKAIIPSLLVSLGEENELKSVSGAINQEKRKVQQLGEDLLPIHVDMEALEDESFTSSKQLMFVILFILPPFLFLGGMGAKWKVSHSSNSHIKRRKQQAWTQFQKTLKTLSSENTDQKQLAIEVMKAIKTYIGNKTGETGDALTAGEMQLWILQQNDNPDLAKEVKTLFEQIQMLQFASGVDAKATSNLLEQSLRVIKQVEK